MLAYRKVSDEKLNITSVVTETPQALFQPGPCLMPDSKSEGAKPVGADQFTDPVVLLQQGGNYVDTQQFIKKLQDFNDQLSGAQRKSREGELKKFRDWLNKNVPICDHVGDDLFAYTNTNDKVGKMEWEVLSVERQSGGCVVGFKFYEAPFGELFYGTQSKRFLSTTGREVLISPVEEMLKLGFKMCAVNEFRLKEFIPCNFVYVTNEQFMKQRVQVEQKQGDMKTFESYRKLGDKMEPFPSKQHSLLC